MPTCISGLYWQKRHIEGWVQVDMQTASYDGHWIYYVLITGLFLGLSAYYDVYRRVHWLTEFVEKSETQAAKDAPTVADKR